MLEGVISLRGWETSNKVDSGPLELSLKKLKCPSCARVAGQARKNVPTDAPENKSSWA